MNPGIAGRNVIDERRQLRLLERRRRLARFLLAAPALLTAAVRAPDALSSRDLGHGATRRNAGGALIDQRVAVLRIGIFVGDFLQHPWVGLIARLRLPAAH